MIKFLSFAVFAMIVCAECNGKENNYIFYHLAINNAERSIFIEKNANAGLGIFKSTFENYEYAFVDDCIEAFELALYFKRDDYAMLFIKKALQNGFELKLLALLNTGCPCNYFAEHKKVDIFDHFIEKHRTVLNKYADSCYTSYVARQNKAVYNNLIKRHTKEQLFKNIHKELYIDAREQEKAYDDVCADNLAYMDSLAAAGIFIGERNIGIYTNKLASKLHFDFGSIEEYKNRLIKFYHLPTDAIVPVKSEEEYFISDLVYAMRFHAKNTFEHMTVYKEAAIKSGYLHPREYASLQFHPKGIKDSMLLCPSNVKVANSTNINNRRRANYLPDYEIDYEKHRFAHEHNLQLFFGFFNGTR